MSRLADNLRTLMAARGLSEPALAAAVGINQSTINRILRGESKDPRDSTIEPLATYFGVTVEALKRHVLMTNAPPVVRVPAFTVRGVDGPDGIDPATDAMIPVTDVEVAAGSPDSPPIPEFLPTRYQLPYQLSWLHANGAQPRDILIMPVRGRSMEPVLWHGDKIVLHRGRTRVHDGSVYALVQPEGARVKRLFNMPDGGLRIVSDNPDKMRYPDEVVLRQDMFRVLILGQAIDRMGSGGL